VDSDPNQPGKSPFIGLTATGRGSQLRTCLMHFAAAYGPIPLIYVIDIEELNPAMRNVGVFGAN
jgi:hypothetical protein